MPQDRYKTRYVFNPVSEHIDVYLSTTRDNHHKLVPGEILHTVERDRVPLFFSSARTAVMTPIHSSSTPPFDTQNWRGNS